MLHLPYTSITAATLAALFVVLSRRVIKLRHKHKIGVGDGEHLDLRRAIRAQGNFAEYAPLTLLLFILSELQGASQIFMGFVCTTFVAGRFIHAYGISQVRENFRLRVAGMICTLLPMVASVFQLFYRALLF